MFIHDWRVSAALVIACVAIWPSGIVAQAQKAEPVQPSAVRTPEAGMPALVPFADAKHWMLRDPLRYPLANSSEVIVVPAGFVTDYASVPRPLWALLAPTGKYLLAAIVHDYLYWEQVCERGEADRLFLLLMDDAGVSFPARWSMYAAVQGFGRGAWTANQRERKHENPRVIPVQWMAIPDKQTWPQYQRVLFNRGVHPAQQMHPRERFCDRGS